MAAPAIARPGTATKPGAFFGLPGITRPMSELETNDGLTATQSQGNQVAQTGVVSFKQTDIVEFYEVRATFSPTVTVGSATVAISPYFPYNFFGPGSLQMQNQFASLSWASGIDLAIWQHIRPMFATQVRDELYQLPRSNAYSAPTNLITASNYTTGSTTVKFTLELPVSIWFDIYFPLDAQGRILGPAQKAWVSPQCMAGTQRVVAPVLNYFPLQTTTASANNDQSPYISTGTQTGESIVCTSSLSFRRNGYKQPTDPNGSDSPPLYNWQYTRTSSQVGIGARSGIDIPVPTKGQLLSIALRLFDPSTGTGGQPIPMSSITNAYLFYGSGIYRFQDRPIDMQARFIQQRESLPFTDGLVVWDLAQDKKGNITNQYALNTYNTSGIYVHLDFSGTQTAACYAQVLVEALQWLTQG